jgi:hypothetical protein
MWTRFMDMHSGGATKVVKRKNGTFTEGSRFSNAKGQDINRIYIEADEVTAKVIFYNRFGHNPERVTCTCCGEDYSISSDESLEQLTAFDRNCHYTYFDPKGNEVPESKAWVQGKGIKRGYSSGYAERKSEKYSLGEYQSLDDYRQREDVLFIPASEIKDSEREGDVPEQGYVWV